jgi:hypothetical protein
LIGFVGARSSQVLAEQIVRFGTGEYGSQGGEQGGSLIKEAQPGSAAPSCGRSGRSWRTISSTRPSPFTTYPQEVRRFFGAALRIFDKPMPAAERMRRMRERRRAEDAAKHPKPEPEPEVKVAEACSYDRTRRMI